MPTCPHCRGLFDGGAQYCPRDGSPLELARVPQAPATAALDDASASLPETGKVLGGRYRLVERLGQGGMGTVYRAMHALMDKPVAVKVLRAELATDTEAVARFHREARSASRLDHEHCIRVTDFGQSEEGLLYLVMELLEGMSLGQLLRSRGSLDEGRAAAIGSAIAEALGHAHEQGVIHRDLKPDNVFLARRGKGRETVKVLDFGLAKLAADSTLGPAITRDGVVFGTPEYMAPEQAEGDPLDGRTDLYALGILLYQLTTGRVPFSASNFIAVLTKQVKEAPAPPRSFRPELSSAFEEVVLRCLAKRPEARFSNADEVAETLRPLGDGFDSEPSLRTSARVRSRSSDFDLDEPSAPESRRPRKKAIFGLSALALLSALCAAAVTSRRPPTPNTVLPVDPIAPIEDVRQFIARGLLDEAGTRLEVLRRRSDSPEVEELLSTLAEKRGNRLRALAHQHRATRLQPRDPLIRAHLAALLLRLGQSDEGCRQAAIASAAALPSSSSPIDPERAALAKQLVSGLCPPRSARRVDRERGGLP